MIYIYYMFLFPPLVLTIVRGDTRSSSLKFIRFLVLEYPVHSFQNPTKYELKKYNKWLNQDHSQQVFNSVFGMVPCSLWDQQCSNSGEFLNPRYQQNAIIRGRLLR